MTAKRDQGKVAGVVRCPRDITGPEWVKLWGDCQTQLRHQGSWRLTDAPQLKDYVQAKKAAAAAQARIEQDGEVVMGSKGQPRPHPLFAVKNMQLDLAYRIAEAIGLTARARAARGLDQRADTRGPGPGDQYGGMD